MEELKKTFAKPEAEIIKFEKTDVIATSGEDTMTTGSVGGQGFSGGQSFN